MALHLVYCPERHGLAIPCFFWDDRAIFAYMHTAQSRTPRNKELPMPTVVAVCTSDKKGVAKHSVDCATLTPGHGIEHDAHAGPWHRQVSLLSLEKVEDFRRRGAIAPFGCFGENLVVQGIDFASLPVGTQLRCNSVLLEMSQIGKECHNHCAIYHSMGECIMPTQGVFAQVLQGGCIRPGDTMEICEAGTEGKPEGKPE